MHFVIDRVNNVQCSTLFERDATHTLVSNEILSKHCVNSMRFCFYIETTGSTLGSARRRNHISLKMYTKKAHGRSAGTERIKYQGVPRSEANAPECNLPNKYCVARRVMVGRPSICFQLMPRNATLAMNVLASSAGSRDM